VVLAAVKENGLALQSAEGGLRADREVVLAAVEQDGDSAKAAASALTARWCSRRSRARTTR